MSDAQLQARYQVIPYAGSKLLYDAATGLEKAMADVDAQRIINLPDWVITDQWDPYLISFNNLPYLAWGMGVNLWESDYWSEGTKRQWVADQWYYKSIRGTPAAYRMALGLSGYTITDMVRPPQGFWASPDLTKEEFDAWIRQMPQIRIKFADRRGVRGWDEFFIDQDNPELPMANVGFLDQDYAGFNDGPVLFGREAVIRQHGIDTPLNTIVFTPSSETRQAMVIERYSTVGKATNVFFTDDGAIEADYIDAEEVAPELITLQFDRSYEHDTSELSLTTIVPGLTPLTPRYERNSDIGDGNSWFFLDVDVVEDPERFIDREDGGDQLLADRVYLLDPTVSAPMTEGMSFTDISRIGIEPYLAEVQVDLHMHEPGPAMIIDVAFVEEAFLIDEDTSHIDRACRAMVDAKAYRDTILASFAPLRPLRAGDRVTDAMKYGQWVADPL
jgi:phage tail P2-like protein